MSDVKKTTVPNLKLLWKNTTIRNEEIKRRREDLLQHGFDQTWINKISRTHPYLFSIKSVSDTRKFLSKKGFKNSHKMIQGLPQILGYTPETIDKKIKYLRKKGFRNPIKIIETLPQILGYKEESMTNKIKNLKKLGLKNPQKMIESLPAILSLNPENISRRVHLLKRLKETYNLPFSPIELMEKEKMVFSTKTEKLTILAEIIHDYHLKPHKLNILLLKKLLKNNLEDLLMAYTEKPNGEEIEELFSRTKKIKKKNFSTAEKRARIRHDLKNQTVKQTYFSAYPEKNDLHATSFIGWGMG